MPTPSPSTEHAGRVLADLSAAERRVEELEAEHRQLLADPDVIQEDRDASAQTLATARAALESVRAAAQLVEDGAYGRCVACGDAIPAERLDALPGTTHCVACS